MNGIGQLAVTAAVSAAVSATLTYMLVAKELARNTAEANAALAEVSAEVSRLGRLVAQRDQATLPAQASTAQHDRTPDDELDSNQATQAFDERLTAIEEALAALESVRQGQPQSNLQDFATRATPYTANATSGDEYRPNTAGEALFEAAADTGKGGSHATAIEEVFHNTGLDVSLNDVYCKDNVCKVTYRDTGQVAPGARNKGAQIQLPDQISATRPDADLDVYYGRTERGDTVMYLQME